MPQFPRFRASLLLRRSLRRAACLLLVDLFQGFGSGFTNRLVPVFEQCCEGRDGELGVGAEFSKSDCGGRPNGKSIVVVEYIGVSWKPLSFVLEQGDKDWNRDLCLGAYVPHGHRSIIPNILCACP